MKTKNCAFRGGVEPSSRATFRLDGLKSNLKFLLRRIKEYCHVMTNKTLRHPELVSGSHGFTGKTLRFRNKFGMTKHSTFCHPEFFDKANKRKFELSEPVPRVAGSQEHEILKQVQNDIKTRHAFKKALAFTLAETLIVMGIIGVVAALTIPNLNSSTADKEKVAKVKKIYSNINDAFGRAEAVYGPFDEWFQTDTTATAQVTRFGERISEFMKVSKNCGVTTDQGCFSNKKTIQKKSGGYSGIAVKDSSADYYKLILADGSSLIFFAPTSGVAGIYVNIDGPNKGTPILGKNVFLFNISEEKGVYYQDFSSMLAFCFDMGQCSFWVIQNDNMDYLKADSSGKCPNGKVLNMTTNTSCK